jgi:hydroxyacylglutathione hydrolase
MFVAGFPSLATATNCWVVAPADGEQCLIIDPGIGVVAPLDEILSEHRLAPVAVLLTHGHYDHTFSVVPVCGARDIPAYVHPADRVQLTDPWTWVGMRPGESVLGIPELTLAEPADVRELDDGASLQLAGLTVAVSHAPGHSRGSVVFSTSDADGGDRLFSGDVLFAGTIGRTDLPGSSMAQMQDSLRRVILPLDDDVVVHPGHGESTSIGRERAVNPFLRELADQW